MQKPTELLHIITGIENNEYFGQPFITAFEALFKNAYDGHRYVATGISCSLFLSSIKKGFPTEKLHTYVRNIQDEYPFIIFNCNKYDELYNSIGQHSLLLIDKNMTYHKTEVNKNDIFEAFDFVTNV